MAPLSDGLWALDLGQVGRLVEAIVKGEAMVVHASAHGLDEARPRRHSVKVDDSIPDEALFHRQPLPDNLQFSSVLLH